ncbi:tyrosine-type recombinase/integrase [Bacillaceae bacterium Marseille-Q3522]|nr:tyrosine-type recombinase/integrase [Bacillaceae bacterium Marseille-Q3522]
MKYVEALRDIKQINAIKNYLQEHSERDYLLFVFGINTGLKISEMLTIKGKDVVEKGYIKDFYQQKTSETEVYLNEQVKKALYHFIRTQDVKEEEYLFMSRKTKQPITRQQAYRVIHDAALAVGVAGKIGTNSMRKTFGYHAYKRGVAVALLQKHFHHSCPSETFRYIGIAKDEKLKTEIDVNL